MSNISVVLTVWKRNNLATQLEYITNQTADISDIYVYQNESHVDITYLKDRYDFKHIHSKENQIRVCKKVLFYCLRRPSNGI